MDAYGCWLMGLTGTNGVWRGDLLQVMSYARNQNSGSTYAQVVQDLYHMEDDALMMLLHEAMPENRRESRLLEYLQAARRKEPSQILEILETQHMYCAVFYEDDFPEVLRHIPDPPLGLYWKGRLPDPDRPAAAVIGARMASAYGRAEARDFAIELARNGVQIISGMARGIDGIAGLAALEVSDDSYAVLGSGADVCFPRENENLYQQLALRGGVISEFPPGTAAVRTNFPQRNRIISGLSQVVLVIEAREKSGTLITADMAAEQGRDVFALPGRVTDRTSHGCNELIRQGAFPATSPDDILTFLFSETAEHVRMRNHTEEILPEAAAARMDQHREEAKTRAALQQKRLQERLSAMGDVERAVYTQLDASTPCNIDGLLEPVRKSLRRKVTFSELMRAVTALLLAGLVKELRVGNYIKITNVH